MCIIKEKNSLEPGPALWIKEDYITGKEYPDVFNETYLKYIPGTLNFYFSIGTRGDCEQTTDKFGTLWTEFLDKFVALRLNFSCYFWDFGT